MKVQRLYLVLLVMSLAILSNAALAQDMVFITERFFNPQPLGVRLCAQTVPGIPNIPMTFFGEGVYGTHPVPATATTNSLGFGCAKAFWPVGVYSVQVNAGPVWSPFVAVTVAPQSICCGLTGGGALALFHYGVPKNITRTLEPRFATFGILFDEGCNGRKCAKIPFQLLYFDHDNPLGPVSFVAKSFISKQFGIAPNPSESVRFVGNGQFQLGADPPKYVRYIAEIIDGNPDQFYLEIRDFAGKVLYQSSIGISFEGLVISGQVDVDCVE